MNLIVEADDFGLTENISRGILKCLKYGIVTDTNAIVNSSAFDASANLALQEGITQMGLHCLLTMGKPVLPVEQVRSLVTTQGTFYTRQELMQKEINIHEAEVELEAQIAKLLRSGLTMSHITTHHGFVNHSKDMVDLFHRLAKKYQVPIRNEFTRKGETIPWKDVPMVDMVYFNHEKVYHTTSDIIAFLEKANTLYESIELGCHPGYSDATLRQISSLNDDREKELQVCLDEHLSSYVKEKQINLMSYAEFAQMFARR